MVLAQQGLVGAMQSIVDLTYLADTVVLSRYYAWGGEEGTVGHQETQRQPRAHDSRDASRQERISLGEPLRDLRGVLTGTPSVINEVGEYRVPS